MSNAVITEPCILAEATKIIEKYHIALKLASCGWSARALEMPEVVGCSKTAYLCIEAVHEGLIAGVCILLTNGKRPPSPLTTDDLLGYQVG